MQQPVSADSQLLARALDDCARNQMAQSSPARQIMAMALSYAARAAEAASGPEENDILIQAQALLMACATLPPPPLLPPSPPRRRDPQPYEAVYINLPHRVDRRSSIEHELNSAGFAAARFEACTGEHAPESHVTRVWDSTLNAKFDTKTIGHHRVAMSAGERGCAMSHRTLWEVVAQRPDESPPVLVLEDDAILTVDFVRQLTTLIEGIEATWNEPSSRTIILYLCADVAKWRGPNLHVEQGLGIREAAYLWQTAAYVIWSPAARMLLPHALPIDCPVDVFLARSTLRRQIRSFVSQPPLARQAVPFQNGDILHTNFYKPHVKVEPHIRARIAANQIAMEAATMIDCTDWPASAASCTTTQPPTSQPQPQPQPLPVAYNTMAPAAVASAIPLGGVRVSYPVPTHVSYHPPTTTTTTQQQEAAHAAAAHAALLSQAALHAAAGHAAAGLLLPPTLHNGSPVDLRYVHYAPTVQPQPPTPQPPQPEPVVRVVRHLRSSDHDTHSKNDTSIPTTNSVIKL